MKNAIAVVVVMLAALTLAAEKAVCRVTYTTAAAGVTSSPLGVNPDGGATDAGVAFPCSWPAGGNVLVQCSSDVYVSYTLDGGAPVTATSNDNTFQFSSNLDPIPVCLQNSEQHISVLGVTAAGTCKFSPTTLRRCPR